MKVQPWKMPYSHTKVPFFRKVKTNKMLKQIEWEVQNGLIAKNRVSSLTNLFFSNFNFEPLLNSLFNVPVTQMRIVILFVSA